MTPMVKKCHTLEEKVVLFSAEIQRLRSTTQTETEGSKKKIIDYEDK